MVNDSLDHIGFHRQSPLGNGTVTMRHNLHIKINTKIVIHFIVLSGRILTDDRFAGAQSLGVKKKLHRSLVL